MMITIEMVMVTARVKIFFLSLNSTRLHQVSPKPLKSIFNNCDFCTKRISIAYIVHTISFIQFYFEKGKKIYRLKGQTKPDHYTAKTKTQFQAWLPKHRQNKEM